MMQVVNQRMTPEQFVYWLQGLLELSPNLKTLDENQVQTIRDHLNYVFTHGHIKPNLPSQDITWTTLPNIPYIGSGDKFPPNIAIC